MSLLTVYESVVIFDVQMTDDARETVLKDMSGMITASGGSVHEIVPYGIRKLAMDLKGRNRGDYRILRFAAGGDILQKIDRTLRLKDEVLRFLITRYYPPKPKKVRKKKLKVDAAPAEPEGEVAHGKPEQSVADREHNPTA